MPKNRFARPSAPGTKKPLVALANRLRAQSATSSFRSVRSASVNSIRRNGSGNSTSGWYGQVRSPGSVLVGARRSRKGKTGFPVTRSNSSVFPIFVQAATTSTRRPSRVIVARFGGAGMSRSHKSCRISWKCQRYFPVRASIATTQLANRFCPRCPTPTKFGFGPPVVT
jgi:hypothetical protein